MLFTCCCCPPSDACGEEVGVTDDVVNDVTATGRGDRGAIRGSRGGVDGRGDDDDVDEDEKDEEDPKSPSHQLPPLGERRIIVDDDEEEVLSKEEEEDWPTVKYVFVVSMSCPAPRPLLIIDFPPPAPVRSGVEIPGDVGMG